MRYCKKKYNKFLLSAKKKPSVQDKGKNLGKRVLNDLFSVMFYARKLKQDFQEIK